MHFKSILFNNNLYDIENIDEPLYFKDLNLDQVINVISSSKKEYKLKPYFLIPLKNQDLINYRIEIFKDLENESLVNSLEDFAEKMVSVRNYTKLGRKEYYVIFKQAWFLETVLAYCEGLSDLFASLNDLGLTSHGLNNFREFLKNYIDSAEFVSLSSEVQHIKNSLTSITFCLNVFHGGFSVKKFNNEETISQNIVETFSRFKEDNPKDYRIKLFLGKNANHIDAKMIEFVSRFFPEPFDDLNLFYNQHQNFFNKIIGTFDREVQFYLGILEFYAKFRKIGLNFCYPEFSPLKNDIFVTKGFDIALADKYLESKNKIICNNFFLKGEERIIVVSGPNQGGKTTFARMFGQSFYFASLGIPIPGIKARIFLPDNIFTHFENEESISTLRGKLQDELHRIKVIFSKMTSNSIIIINEIFTSTTLADAIFLSKEIMNQLITTDVIGLTVTFIDELSELGPQTVSMVSSIIPDNPSVRTFKITRKEADGLAYAFFIAKKHGVTYEDIMERLNP